VLFFIITMLSRQLLLSVPPDTPVALEQEELAQLQPDPGQGDAVQNKSQENKVLLT
jgi:hypothetical protein